MLTALMLLSAQGIAQRTKVFGYVLDAQTNEPVPFVNLAFAQTKIGTSSNIEGYFELESYYATDTLLASAVGYMPQRLKIKRDQAQRLDIYLSAGEIQLQEFTVRAKDHENPAHRILRNIIRNKPVNNREKLEAYEYELYNRMEFDLNNFSESFTKQKLWRPFDFVFDYVDSTSNDKVFLPMLISETISDYHFRKRPRARKEIIKASKVSGIENESITQFMGQMYLDFNVYDNNIVIFDKGFVSPISANGLVFYKYYLEDSTYIDNKWCYKIRYVPRRKQELTFKGEFWVNDTTWAIKDIHARIAEDANINFVTDIIVDQSYDEVEPEVWMMTREEIVVDFQLQKGQVGVYGRKTSLYRNFVINQPRDDDFYRGSDDVEVLIDHRRKGKDFWDEARFEPLTERQRNIYLMVDSLQNNRRFQAYTDIISILTTGYKVMGPLEWGPFWSSYSWNPVEGDRVRLGGRTSNNFSTRLMLEGYLAYGFKDQEFKWSGGGQYFLSKKPWQSVGLYFTRDLEQIGRLENFFQRDNMLTSLFRRAIPLKLILVEEWKGYYDREWVTGFSNRLTLSHARYSSIEGFEFERRLPESDDTTTVPSITSAEVSLKTRWAHKERFVHGEFTRVSLGTRYPIFEFEYALGLQGIIGSEYNYHRARFSMSHKLLLGIFGKLRYRIEAGKFWGDLPYPLLQVHQGNETFFSSEVAFNLMNFYEFVSDQYAMGWAEYHLDGFFLNRIPLMRKLKWREVVGARAVYGSLSEANLREMLLPEDSYILDRGPYAEASVGIENIFKFFRVEGIWRLTYRDHDKISNFGVRIRMAIHF
ncbi:MAG: carboxypeptidase-like regulatory domain-containing protein [Cryomorphaceae bacterium]|nr:MAG: carboxypeptidase-like regulatory domain-containing protein [Cryomorphaceae bacterium]